MFPEKDILILDGAMGTMIQRYGLSEDDFHGRPFSDISCELAGNNECLNLTRPDIIEEIHRQYIEAGADIIESNTFSANSISQQEYGCSGFAPEMAREGARIARRAADRAFSETGRRIIVAGSIGPTSKSLSLAPDITDPSYRPYSFDDMASAYRQQAEALIEGGADLIQIETCFDALNVKAALYAIWQMGQSGIHDRFNGRIPVIVSVSVADRSGRTLTGQTLEAFYASISHYPLAAFGLNCSLGAAELAPLVKEISGWCRCPVICYPNAGLPNEMGGYDQSPEEMAAAIRQMASDGLIDIVGGCCGTTPEHIKAIASAVKGIAPRRLSGKNSVVAEEGLTVSGLEAVCIDLEANNFTNIGERTNVAGSRKFARLIASGDYTSALQIAADQIENGASVIDINMDDAMLDSTLEMERFCRHISNDPAAAKAALMIDSSHWETILAGLKNSQGKCIVNSISLKEGEQAFIDKALAIRSLGAAMVVMAFDEQGQATTFARKIEICSRAYRLLTRAGIPQQEIIFDANVLSIGTGIEEHARYGIDFIEAVRWIHQNLHGAKTSGGISNLSFAFRGNNEVREAMHSVFLYYAIQAGLDMAIVNPGMLQVYDQIEPEMLKCVEDVIFDRDPGATERLIAKAQKVLQEKEAAKAASVQENAGNGERISTGTGADGLTAAYTVEEKLRNALVKGKSSDLEKDLQEALKKYGGSAVSIIEGPLMDGMEQVGELFGSGKMFLPQVVKSAKVMRDAVAILEPYMPENKAETANGEADGTAGGGTSRPKIILATVKGDVHDIGKNITGIVLTCNGFDVVDLGVMVDRETILEAADRENADIIAVSGLITPSLFQMEELCREMSRRGLDTPLFIGGATTSALHTAVKLAPLYTHVFYGADASASAVMAKRCMMDRQQFEDEEHAAQERIRELYHSKDRQVLDGGQDSDQAQSTASVNADCPVFSADSYIDCRTAGFRDIPAIRIPVKDVAEYFDWRMFLTVFGIRYSGPLPDSKEIRRLEKDGKAVLDAIIAAENKAYGESSDFLKTDESGISLKADEAAIGAGCRIMLAAKFFDACSKDSGISFDGHWLPMFRQESKPGKELPKVKSLCDFVPPESSGKTGNFGMFAISVSETAGSCRGCQNTQSHAGSTDYPMLVRRAVRLTLAEAASTWLDLYLEKCLAAGHNIQDNNGAIKIVKPAAGYASCPDHTLKKDILDLLPGGKKLGIKLTDSYAMIPDASICGFIFAHPQACYPEIRRISKAQYEAYAQKRGMDALTARQFLSHLLD